MACGELAQQRSFFLMDDEMSLKWVGVRWPVSAAENRADLNNTSPVVSTPFVCMRACLRESQRVKEAFLRNIFWHVRIVLYIYFSINITFIYKKPLCNSMTAISSYRVCNVCWYTGKTLKVPHPVLSPEPPLCVHLHVGLTACVLLYSGSENAFHASSVSLLRRWKRATGSEMWGLLQIETLEV